MLLRWVLWVLLGVWMLDLMEHEAWCKLRQVTFRFKHVRWCGEIDVQITVEEAARDRSKCQSHASVGFTVVSLGELLLVVRCRATAKVQVRTSITSVQIFSRSKHANANDM